MIYECPVCKKKVNSISELKNCIVKHESDETAAAKGRINELDNQITLKFDELAKLIKEYNQLNPERVKTISITDQKKSSKNKVNSIPVKIKEVKGRDADKFSFLDSIGGLNDIDCFVKNQECFDVFSELLNSLNKITEEDKKNV